LSIPQWHCTLNNADLRSRGSVADPAARIVAVRSPSRRALRETRKVVTAQERSAGPTPAGPPAAPTGNRPTRAGEVTYPVLVRASRRRSASSGREALRAGWQTTGVRSRVRLAVVASVRHVDTDYDDLLMAGAERESGRAQVRSRVEDILNAWRDGAAPLDRP
jgi:hypothetical protein